jgi:hypothetical protein
VLLADDPTSLAANISTALPEPQDSVSNISKSSRTSSRSSAVSGRSTTSRSKGGSPRKEWNLRDTSDWPVERLDIDQMDPTISQSVAKLVADLLEFGVGDVPVIPDLFRERMRVESAVFKPPKETWFCSTAGASDEEVDDWKYRDRRLREIWASSRRCKKEREHEPGWNDQVHAPMLSLALGGMEGEVRARNITAIRTLGEFADPDPKLGENKVDYGMFLEGFDDDKALLLPLPHHLPWLHLDMPTPAKTPLAISIETKSLRRPEEEGATQLANWVRAHFRQLEAVTKELGVEEMPLPVLPLVFVFGNRWNAAFAQRRNGQTMIYGDVQMGDTNTIEGCYFLYHSLQRLGVWANTEFRAWWRDVLRA